MGAADPCRRMGRPQLLNTTGWEEVEEVEGVEEEDMHGESMPF